MRSGQLALSDGVVNGAYSWRYLRIERGDRRMVDGAVVDEQMVRIHVNGVELANFMCTPKGLDFLALGFLRSEGIIKGLADVRLVDVCPNRSCVDVWLQAADFELPGRAILTSGCGGGITFDDLSQRVQKVDSQRRVTASQLNEGLRQLLAAANLYAITRGVHTSGLHDGQRLIAMAEDVGRHNTIDKLWGFCMRHDIDPAGHLLFATGRISSEMLNKAAKMKVPVVASRTSPTSLSVRLAQEWDMLLAGYVRSHSFNVYAGAWRLLDSD
jgi:FdhD protein